MDGRMKMRDIDWKLLSELMKNSRRSDRELAKAVGSSQPTISRRRKRLEKEGYIREYTMVPDFAKLGYELMALTFLKLRRELTLEELEKAGEITNKALVDGPNEVVMVERGRGMGFQGVGISFHKDYASYMKLLNFLRQFEFLEIFEIGSHIINLKDEIHYRPLTFTTLAEHLLNLNQEKKQ